MSLGARLCPCPCVLCTVCGGGGAVVSNMGPAANNARGWRRRPEIKGAPRRGTTHSAGTHHVTTHTHTHTDRKAHRQSVQPARADPARAVCNAAVCGRGPPAAAEWVPPPRRSVITRLMVSQRVIRHQTPSVIRHRASSVTARRDRA